MSEAVPTAALRLASALDAEDYDAARATLADDCIYHTGTAAVTGPDAIVALYKANGDAARTRFDVIEYASRVDPSGPASARIDYRDRVRRGGKLHEYHCRQHVRVNAAGLIDEIRHEELPGERERLQSFERE